MEWSYFSTGGLEFNNVHGNTYENPVLPLSFIICSYVLHYKNTNATLDGGGCDLNYPKLQLKRQNYGTAWKEVKMKAQTATNNSQTKNIHVLRVMKINCAWWCLESVVAQAYDIMQSNPTPAECKVIFIKQKHELLKKLYQSTQSILGKYRKTTCADCYNVASCLWFTCTYNPNLVHWRNRYVFLLQLPMLKWTSIAPNTGHNWQK